MKSGCVERFVSLIDFMLTCGAFSLFKFSVDKIFRNPSIVGAHQVAKPVHVCLFQQREQAGASSFFYDFIVWDLILPFDVQDASKVMRVGSAVLGILSGTQSRSLAAIQEGTQDAGSVDLKLCVWSACCSSPALYLSLATMLATFPIRCLSLHQVRGCLIGLSLSRQSHEWHSRLGSSVCWDCPCILLRHLSWPQWGHSL